MSLSLSLSLFDPMWSKWGVCLLPRSNVDHLFPVFETYSFYSPKSAFESRLFLNAANWQKIKQLFVFLSFFRMYGRRLRYIYIYAHKSFFFSFLRQSYEIETFTNHYLSLSFPRFKPLRISLLKLTFPRLL